MKLHIGCGKREWPGWINIDGVDLPHIHWRDVTKLPYRNNEADLIYASHLIAYFDRDEIVPILNEWKRVLKPGGILRLATPDFEQLLIAYETNIVPIEGILGPLYGKITLKGMSVYHKTCYNYDSLRTLLLEVGFKDPITWSHNETEHAELDDHSKAHIPHDPQAIETGVYTKNHLPISLNIQVTK